ncbi:hypothetical protein [Streptomyces sp. NPDC090083]|uniref:hypothetical protein n=1 Tax=Streptomyces sp. NPDC090083 TaxID=3365941 RepID=UPI00380DAA89
MGADSEAGATLDALSHAWRGFGPVTSKVVPTPMPVIHPGDVVFDGESAHEGRSHRVLSARDRFSARSVTIDRYTEAVQVMLRSRSPAPVIASKFSAMPALARFDSPFLAAAFQKQPADLNLVT